MSGVHWQGHAHVSWDGTPLHVRTSVPPDGAGDLPWLILVDGIACDGFVWKHIAPCFAGRLPLLHAHYRGHGKSGIPTDLRNLTIPDLVRDLQGILEAFGITRAALLAHSMGVQVILDAWRVFPRRIAALVPICGSFQYPLDTFHESDLLKRLLPLLRMGAQRAPGLFRTILRTTPASAAFAFAWLTEEVNRDLAKREDMLPYFEGLQRLDFRVFTTMLHYASLHSAADVLARIEAPTLIVAATRDAFTPFRLSEEMQRRIRGSEMLVLPEGSHGAPMEFPDLLNLRIEAFLLEKGLLPGGGRAVGSDDQSMS